MYGYIYTIINKVNGKTYIGQHTSNKYWYEDKYMGSGKNLFCAYNKYGKENFEKYLTTVQHIFEQYLCPSGFSSRDPTHCIMTIRFGTSPFDLRSFPFVGPFTPVIRPSSDWVITSSYRVYPYSGRFSMSKSLWPVATTIEPT